MNVFTRITKINQAITVANTMKDAPVGFLAALKDSRDELRKEFLKAYALMKPEESSVLPNLCFELSLEGLTRNENAAIASLAKGLKEVLDKEESTRTLDLIDDKGVRVKAEEDRYQELAHEFLGDEIKSFQDYLESKSKEMEEELPEFDKDENGEEISQEDALPE